MAASEEIIGEEWNERSRELADWAMERLVNRRDVWGQYALLSPEQARESGRTYKAMTLPVPEMRGEDRVTLDKLARHFASRRLHRPQLIGLHAESQEGTSRWLGIDIDNHDLDAVGADVRARRNLAGALAWWRAFGERGYDPLLFDSSGRGGFHLWVLFAEPAPTEAVFDLVKAVATTWEANQLEEEPEVFPKQPRPGSLNAWFRLPGMHHTQPHYSQLWSGEEWLSDPWLEGHAAIDAMLQVIPGPPPPPVEPASAGPPVRLGGGASGPGELVEPSVLLASTPPSAAPSPPFSRSAAPSPPAPKRSAAARKRRFSGAGRPTVCLDLDGVLVNRTYARGAEELGDPIDGAVEFTRALAEQADIVIHTARLGGRSARASDGAAQAEQRRIEERIRAWLDQHGFAYKEIALAVGKPIASAYVDDRGVSCRPLDDGPRAFEEALAAVRRLCGPSG
ncbi:MAG: hypothetical protein NTW51_08335 [Cyanobacteria bacterium]|nr:hypothetical protein [Cyanobacteriota bacterium]